MRASKFFKIFPKNKPVVIGVIHLPPLLGYPQSPGLKVALKNALHDLKAFKGGGVDGIILENNYDLPHKIFVDPIIIACMTFLGEKIRKTTKLPLGINVLWNDYKDSLSIAKVLNLQFIRLPVFVDKVKTAYGIVEGKPSRIINFRKSIGAENVAIFSDIHVKHARLLSKNDLVTAAKLAIKNHTDAVIVTGKWTGEAPDLVELKRVKKAVGKFPVLAGSGVNKTNIKKILEYADGVIVSTALKAGQISSQETNVKSWQQRVLKSKVKELIDSF